MIVVTTKHKGKQYSYKYEGEICISIDNIFLHIDWFIDELPPKNDEELFTWRSNGFDKFWIEDVVSVIGCDAT